MRKGRVIYIFRCVQVFGSLSFSAGSAANTWRTGLFILCLWWRKVGGREGGNEGGRPYLSRHVHEQHGGDGSLGLAVSLLWSVQGVGLEDTEQILLPGGLEHKQY